jgi:hypothetical protein
VREARTIVSSRISTKAFVGTALVASAASYALIAALHLAALPVVAAFWALALVVALWQSREELLAEWAGILFLFCVAGNVDAIEYALGSRQTQLSIGVVALGVVYLISRRADATRVLRSPAGLLLSLFFICELLSAAAFSNPETFAILENRVGEFITIVCALVLSSRRSGDVLVPATVVWGVLMSVPLMFQEIVHQDTIVISSTAFLGLARAGGFYAQSNNAAIALTFAIALSITLVLTKRLRAAALLPIWMLAGAGIICTASRAGLVTMLVLLIGFCFAVAPRAGRRIAFVLATIALLIVALPDQLASVGDVLSNQLIAVGVPRQSVERIGEVFAMLGGSADEFMADDVESGRVANAEAAIQTGLDHPIFGVGTGRFLSPLGMRSHFQLAEIFACNGLIGLALYGAFVFAVLSLVAAAPAGSRIALLFPLGVWLAAHVHTHNLFDFRFFCLPLAFGWGRCLHEKRGTALSHDVDARIALHS